MLTNGAVGGCLLGLIEGMGWGIQKYMAATQEKAAERANQSHMQALTGGIALGGLHIAPAEESKRPRGAAAGGSGGATADDLSSLHAAAVARMSAPETFAVQPKEVLVDDDDVWA